MTILRRKRLQDGSFGELEKVFEGETEQEKVERIESENKELKGQLLEIQEYIINKEIEDLIEKGGEL